MLDSGIGKKVLSSGAHLLDGAGDGRVAEVGVDLGHEVAAWRARGAAAGRQGGRHKEPPCKVRPRSPHPAGEQSRRSGRSERGAAALRKVRAYVLARVRLRHATCQAASGEQALQVVTGRHAHGIHTRPQSSGVVASPLHRASGPLLPVAAALKCCSTALRLHLSESIASLCPRPPHSPCTKPPAARSRCRRHGSSRSTAARRARSAHHRGTDAHTGGAQTTPTDQRGHFLTQVLTWSSSEGVISARAGRRRTGGGTRTGHGVRPAGPPPPGSRTVHP